VGKRLNQFKQRAGKAGQTVSLFSFQAWPAGAYVDAYSDEPDPDHVAFPSTAPAITYAAAVSVRGFLQPMTTQEMKERLMRAEWGQDVEISAKFFCPGDQAIEVNDKVTYGGDTLYVAKTAQWEDGREVVYTETFLTREVPRAS
jgi:hypothetical protein